MLALLPAGIVFVLVVAILVPLLRARAVGPRA